MGLGWYFLSPVQLRSDRVALGGTWPPGGVSPAPASGPWWGGMAEGRGQLCRASTLGMAAFPGWVGDEDVPSQLISMGLKWGSQGVPQYTSGLQQGLTTATVEPQKPL